MDAKGSRLAALRRRPVHLASLAGAVGLMGAALMAACGNVVLDDQSAGSVAGSGGTGGVGGGGGTRSSGNGGGGGGPVCMLTSTGSGGSVTQLTECITPPENTCPNQYNAALYITPHNCAYLFSVDCGPVIEGGQCCYLVEEQAHTCGQ